MGRAGSRYDDLLIDRADLQCDVQCFFLTGVQFELLNLILKTGAIVGGVGINEPDSDAIAIVFLLQRFEAFKTLLGDRATGGGEK